MLIAWSSTIGRQGSFELPRFCGMSGDVR